MSSLLLLCAVVVVVVDSYSSSATHGSGGKIGAVGEEEAMTSRHVSLHATAIDTRVANDAFDSASFVKYLSQFESDTRHQFIVHIKSPITQFKQKIGKSFVSFRFASSSRLSD